MTLNEVSNSDPVVSSNHQLVFRVLLDYLVVLYEKIYKDVNVFSIEKHI
jgi:hypothetical protein